MSDAGAPVVSVVVRSVGRPELQRALASLAHQDHQRLEVLVVDATGGRHPPLPKLEWRAGHSVRMVGSQRPLNRPAAANAGLDQATGVWVGFVDDDDSVDPNHVSALLLAAHLGDVAVYGRGRLLKDDGSMAGLDGLPFNLNFALNGRLCPFGCLLFRRAALSDCRFDEDLEVCEDRDFVAQVAARGPFRHVDQVTFSYHVEAGRSGSAPQGRRLWLRTERYADIVRARWYGDWAYHSLRPMVWARRGVQLLVRGQAPEAIGLLEAALRDHQEDPALLAALALVEHRGRGQCELAASYVRRAIAVDPAKGEYRLVLAEILLRLGVAGDAIIELQRAAEDEASRPAAVAALRRLGHARVEDSTVLQMPPASSAGLAEVQGALQAAREGRHDEAYGLLEAAAERRGVEAEVRSAAKACFDLATRAERHGAAIRFFDAWLKRRNERAVAVRCAGSVHVVGSATAPDAMRSTADHAAAISSSASIHPWCVDSPDGARLSSGMAPAAISERQFPREGCLMVAGYRFNLGLWLFDSSFDSATLVIDDAVEPERLLDRAVEFDCIAGTPALGVAYTSGEVAAIYGIQGLVI